MLNINSNYCVRNVKLYYLWFNSLEHVIYTNQSFYALIYATIFLFIVGLLCLKYVSLNLTVLRLLNHLPCIPVWQGALICLLELVFTIWAELFILNWLVFSAVWSIFNCFLVFINEFILFIFFICNQDFLYAELLNHISFIWPTNYIIDEIRMFTFVNFIFTSLINLFLISISWIFILFEEQPAFLAIINTVIGLIQSVWNFLFDHTMVDSYHNEFLAILNDLFFDLYDTVSGRSHTAQSIWSSADDLVTYAVQDHSIARIRLESSILYKFRSLPTVHYIPGHWNTDYFTNDWMNICSAPNHSYSSLVLYFDSLDPHLNVNYTYPHWSNSFILGESLHDLVDLMVFFSMDQNH